MTFDQRERSNYDGVPTTLYEFAIGDTTKYRYANGTEDVVLGGVTYLGVAVSDSGIIQSGETQNDDFTISLPANTSIADLFRGTPPSQQIFVIVREMHRGDADAPVVWAGTVKSGKRSKLTEFQIVCKTLTSSLNRMGVRLSWGRGCPHALYDRNCRVDKADYATLVQVTALDGAGFNATVSSLGNGYLAGGFVEFEILPGVIDTRPIESHVGDRINLLSASDGIAVGMWMTVYPGCDRVTSTCEAKFNNLSNYGGFPHLPTKNPFDNDPVF